MGKVKSACRPITVVTFRGDRSRLFGSDFRRRLRDAMHGRGPGPTTSECLRFAGHTGVSLDRGATVYGFNPDPGAVPIWQLVDSLEKGDAFPGVVRDDTVEFAAAGALGLSVVSFDVLFPDAWYREFETHLEEERRSSQYTYGFPDGDGDCNCMTWLERLGLPLLTGRMREFVNLHWISIYPRRRFGACIP